MTDERYDDNPLASLPELSPEAEAYLTVRREEAKHIDPATAATDWRYGQTLDPYGVIPAMPEHLSQVGQPDCSTARRLNLSDPNWIVVRVYRRALETYLGPFPTSVAAGGRGRAAAVHPASHHD